MEEAEDYIDMGTLQEASSSLHHHHPSSLFYRQQFIATLGWWILVKLITGKYLYELAQGSVFTRPSWIPASFLYSFHHQPKNNHGTNPRKKWVFMASLVALAVGGWGQSIMIASQNTFLLLRVGIALVVSLYHLLESSVSHRHGEYPLLYNVWAMCIPSAHYASSVSYGIVLHFIFRTGICKILVGGFWQWLSPCTMQHYLNVYNQSSKSLARPLCRSWNRWIVHHSKICCCLISATTLFMECIGIPSTVLLSNNHAEHHRYWMGTMSMIVMHIGIFVIMSKQTGIVFFTTLPTYMVGFRCTATMGTGPWWCAIMVGFLPTGVALLYSFLVSSLWQKIWIRRQQPTREQWRWKPTLLPENWPISAISLFMWSGQQAKVLSDTLLTGNTRIVLCTDNKKKKNDESRSSVIGLPVLYHLAVTPASAMLSSQTTIKDKSFSKDASATPVVVVHDCYLRVIGFTLIQNKLLNVSPPKATISCDGDDAKKWNIRLFLKTLQQEFLVKEQRMIETHTGKPLVKAMLVKLDDTKQRVIEVLDTGDDM